MGHYCVETKAGKLEVSKGAYLTMMKRKNNAVKTLAKRKPISHYHEKKTTVKKPLVKSMGRSINRSLRQKELLIRDSQNNSYTFGLSNDREVFESSVVLPSIDMEYDNDNESEWGEIEENVSHLTLSLSIATFDNHFNR
jgi:hypothetical protein